MSASSKKLCFNTNCKELLERSRKGWRCRAGDYADLCDRCASAYEEGRFCETFHMNASGWRCCESCGKQIHCGCIVSFHTFVLLDAGGIECINCARKSFILTPNPAWPPPSLFLPAVPEKIKDPSNKNWSQIAASGPVPWRQAPSLFNSSSTPSELHLRTLFEVNMPIGTDRRIAVERLSTFSSERKKIEVFPGRPMNGSLKLGASAVLQNGNFGMHSEEQPNASADIPQLPSFSKKDESNPHFGLAVTSSSPNNTNDHTQISGTHAWQPTLPHRVGKQCCGHNGVESSIETQARNGRPRGDARGRSSVLPRYWPRITDQELQQISEDSNSVITPLFQKVLSASDAGRIGRLVLPKKCAEAYFPPISQPEGMPLKVQDLKGKEWIFQFRFWPNNNSRMYVLEGVTPCIQSMQLQAGDTVTFNRSEPEGKLVMGFRKTSTASPSDQCNVTDDTGDGVSTHGDVSTMKAKPSETVLTHHHLKGNWVSPSCSTVNQANSADPASMWSKVDKSGYIAKETIAAKTSFRIKRKSSLLGSRSKRLKFENEDVIEVKVTLEQAQGLLRPPPDHVPTIVVVEGFEFEEYEDAPIIGRPTIFATDPLGEKTQWAQCESCFKWRKVPVDALLPSRWTCPQNSWDPERSLCSVTQELTAEELEDVPHSSNQVASNKLKAAKQDPDLVEALEGLDTLANLAIQEGVEFDTSSSQATTKHPRHRPGCSCIVCIQPPSGKGHKHKQTCTCNVCLTVKRRFRTLMLRRAKKQSEKEAETARQKQQQLLELPDQLPEDDVNTENSSPSERMMDDEDPEDELSQRKTTLSPFKGQIDLNIQPEREEELSPGSDSGSAVRLLQRLSNSPGDQMKQADVGVGGGSSSNADALGSNHDEAEAKRPVTLPMNAPASMSATER